MTYILHMMGGRDIEVTDEEHQNIVKAVEGKEDKAVIRKNEEIITLNTISSSEKVIEPPKYEANAVEDFMERTRGAKKENNQPSYGSHQSTT
jgi:hypothetical protein